MSSTNTAAQLLGNPKLHFQAFEHTCKEDVGRIAHNLRNFQHVTSKSSTLASVISVELYSPNPDQFHSIVVSEYAEYPLTNVWQQILPVGNISHTEINVQLVQLLRHLSLLILRDLQTLHSHNLYHGNISIDNLRAVRGHDSEWEIVIVNGAIDQVFEKSFDEEKLRRDIRDVGKLLLQLLQSFYPNINLCQQDFSSKINILAKNILLTDFIKDCLDAIEDRYVSAKDVLAHPFLQRANNEDGITGMFSSNLPNLQLTNLESHWTRREQKVAKHVQSYYLLSSLLGKQVGLDIIVSHGTNPISVQERDALEEEQLCHKLLNKPAVVSDDELARFFCKELITTTDKVNRKELGDHVEHESLANSTYASFAAKIIRGFHPEAKETQEDASMTSTDEGEDCIQQLFDEGSSLVNLFQTLNEKRLVRTELKGILARLLEELSSKHLNTNHQLPENLRPNIWITILDTLPITSQQTRLVDVNIGGSISLSKKATEEFKLKELYACREAASASSDKEQRTRLRQLSRQLSQDLPRCHQKNHVIRSETTKRRIMKTLTLFTLGKSNQRQVRAYWQGLDSVCAVFSVVFIHQSDAVLLHAFEQFVEIHQPGMFVEDNSNAVQARTRALAALIAFFDPIQAKHLAEMKMDLTNIVLRWVMTMFSYSFPLNVVLRIWDFVLLSSLSPFNPNGGQFIMLAASLLFCFRNQVLSKTDFGSLVAYLNDITLDNSDIVDRIVTFCERCIRLSPEFLEFRNLDGRSVPEEDERSLFVPPSICIDQFEKHYTANQLVLLDTRDIGAYNLVYLSNSLHVSMQRYQENGDAIIKNLKKKLTERNAEYKSKVIAVGADREGLERARRLAKELAFANIPMVCVLVEPIEAVFKTQTLFKWVVEGK